MATENISTSANCKHCGGTIIVEVTGVPVDMPSHQGRTGGVTSRACGKCHKTSIYSYEIREGHFTRLY
jgi:hypothetical protein